MQNDLTEDKVTEQGGMGLDVLVILDIKGNNLSHKMFAVFKFSFLVGSMGNETRRQCDVMNERKKLS